MSWYVLYIMKFMLFGDYITNCLVVKGVGGREGIVIDGPAVTKEVGPGLILSAYNFFILCSKKNLFQI